LQHAIIASTVKYIEVAGVFVLQ